MCGPVGPGTVTDAGDDGGEVPDSPIITHDTVIDRAGSPGVSDKIYQEPGCRPASLALLRFPISPERSAVGRAAYPLKHSRGLVLPPCWTLLHPAGGPPGHGGIASLLSATRPRCLGLIRLSKWRRWSPL